MKKTTPNTNSRKKKENQKMEISPDDIDYGEQINTILDDMQLSIHKSFDFSKKKGNIMDLENIVADSITKLNSILYSIANKKSKTNIDK